MKREAPKTLLEPLDQAWDTWKGHPDGANFRNLARELALLTEAVIANARGGGPIATFSAPLPVAQERIRITVHFKPNGQRVIEQHRHVRDFDDVVQEFQLHTLERFLRNPNFRIKDEAFIRIGLALRAYSMERAVRREALRSLPSDSPGAIGVDEERTSPRASATLEMGPDEQFVEILEEIWFHPSHRPARSPLVQDAPGLSLRYLYTTLRVHSGVRLQEIGQELGIHASRLTALKKELNDLLPSFTAEWLPMGDFLPLNYSREVLESLDLISARSRFSLIRDLLDHKAHGQIQRHKRVLWEAYLWAREQLEDPQGLSSSLCQRKVANEYQELEAVLEIQSREQSGELLKVHSL